MGVQSDRATLDVVAAAAGVSRMTVSNAYNRPHLVAPATLARVLEAAADVGYGGPSPVGRNLRRGSTNVLGLLSRVGLPDAFSDPAAAEFMRGIAQGCDEADLSLQIVHATGPSARRRVRNAAVDAFVAWSLSATDPAMTAALERRVPIVAFGGTDEIDAVPYVSAQNTAGAEAVAAHLLDSGVERVAAVTCHVEIKEFGDRLTGWRSALEASGIDWCTVHVVDQPASSRVCGRSAAAALCEVFRPGERWGVLAMTDVLALGVLQALVDRGIRVPEEVAVAGFDDIDEAAAANPALTTVRQDIAGLGRECALRAAGRVTGITTPHPAELVVRDSTRPATAAGTPRARRTAALTDRSTT